MSRPAWARGLKQPKYHLKNGLEVAPRVGAWIETPRMALAAGAGCRAPRGRVD